ncbi:SDR family NAD(P)-dependent oxidoreductase [Burkholderia multivorans]|uniref:SDR family NAD(P)-dependent oxidoreductase n=1 Tax=Burkholderia multivorans TaxID=87883 RepID=UPI001C2657AB|nr:SDR family NAD(P)-dependent oxidoreductase [Burkholderia multivorans]MBU9597977.1 SDR family NAD(P)-dependent oxidoreductase [Burkholderia multivorans]
MIDRHTVAFVSGANRGLGAQFVARLLARGAGRVYAASRTGHTEFDDARVIPVTLDITDDDSVAHAARIAADTTLLVNNAGINRQSGILVQHAMDDARAEMDVNYFGTWRMARAFAPLLIESKGAMINVLSILARVSLPAMGSLCASKAAGLRLTECLRAELMPHGVRVFAALPGAIDTDMSRGFDGPKLDPAATADTALDALTGERYEVYIGSMAQGLEHGLALERAATQAQLLSTS